MENLKDIENKENYTFVKADICDKEQLVKVFDQFKIDGVIHLAAESHVDRSITNPLEFATTNVMGTLTLLQTAKEAWKADFTDKLFYHVSTDEVYGSLGNSGFFVEDTLTIPNPLTLPPILTILCVLMPTPILPIILWTNQFPEKLLPLFINNIQHNAARLWQTKCARLALCDIGQSTPFSFLKVGKSYNIGGEWTNIDLIKFFARDKKLGRKAGESEKLITYVTDRAGHDLRYAIDSSKLKNELGWQPSLQFEQGLEKTVDWYLGNAAWLKSVTSGDYQDYYKKMYGN